MAEPRRRKRGEARRQIIEAAREELVAGKGELDVAQVAVRAQVSEGIVYYHFKNKLGLLTALVEDFYARLDETILGLPMAGATWQQRERLRTRAYVQHMYEDPIGFYVVNNLLRLPALHELSHLSLAGSIEEGTRNIAQGQRQGDVAAQADPELLVTMILAGAGAGVSRAMRQSPDRPWEDVFEEVWAFIERAAGLGRADAEDDV